MAEPYQLGHRERARERFLKRDTSFFENYELFELLLFYSIPRKDVKSLAKALLKTFGSLRGVMLAPAEQLEQVQDI